MSIKIFLADDHQIVLDGLRNLIESQSDLEIIGTATDGRAAIEQISELKPDLVICDVKMPGMNGMDVARRSRELNPRIKIIALTMHLDLPFMKLMLKAGATGYLHKSSDFGELVFAIHEVMAGKIYLSPSLSGSIAENFVKDPESLETSAFNVLTEREREVVQLMAEGKSTKEIALNLKLSRPTIETHRRRIMNKLNLGSVAELTKYAVREGLTSLQF